MLNKIFIMGRLTRDPELRRTQNGTAVTSFTLAVDRDFKNADGTKDTDFIDVVAWRTTAEFVSKYFSKGRMAVVEGRLQRTETSAGTPRCWRTTSTLAMPRRTWTAAPIDTRADSSWRWTRTSTRTAICHSDRR